MRPNWLAAQRLAEVPQAQADSVAERRSPTQSTSALEWAVPAQVLSTQLAEPSEYWPAAA